MDAPQPREEPPPPAVEQMEKELIESEENLKEEELPSPTPSDEDMDEYRLRM